MTDGALPEPSPTLRTKASILLAVPLLVLGLGYLLPSPRSDDSAFLDNLQERLQARFGQIADAAARTADAALARVSPDVVADPQTRFLQRRVEGVGILGPNMAFLDWSGTPAEPPAGFGDPLGSRWRVSLDGVRTRLLVRAGPDDQGRFALVSLILDSILPAEAFGELLPGDLRRLMRVDIDFGVDRAPPADRDTAGVRVFPLTSPTGEILGVATLVPVSRSSLVAGRHRTAGAWAAALGVLLATLLFDWKRTCTGSLGPARVTLVLAAGRALLLWQEVPARLLPRELGAPSLYGSSALWGLLSSPADLLLTAMAIYALCLACRRCAEAGGVGPRRTPRLAGAGLLALLALAGTWALVQSLARNTRVPLIDRPSPFEWDGRLLLWLALVLLILTASELIVLTVALLRREPSRPFRVGRIPVGLTFLTLAAVSTEGLQTLTEGLALEQLRTGLAPSILEQSSRREVALLDAMNGVRARLSRDDASVPTSAPPDSMAFRYWVESELFHSGYRSSLEFYTPAGDRISHFQFDLPVLQPETLAPVDGPGDGIPIREEFFDEVPSVQQRALHAEIPVFRGSEQLGVVVGHVLDEPDNLPFLPRFQPYLAALGPGAPRLDEVFNGWLEYVLYDEFGSVVLTTLLQPPADSGKLRGAGEHDELVHVTAGERDYVGVALDEGGERLHLLLIPSPGALERLAEIVRVALLGWWVMVSITLATRLLRPGGLVGVVGEVRGSFYRKLLASLLLASLIPLVGLALVLRGYVERRADASLIASATQFVTAAQRVLEDYSNAEFEQASQIEFNDAILYWLSSVVGQEIHVYRAGRLEASSKRELFASGLLSVRLAGDVQRRLIGEGLPHWVEPQAIGGETIPVAYAPVRLGGVPQRVVAVPLVLEQRQIAADAARVREMILLSTVGLMVLLAVAAAYLARTVARPVRALVGATERIASGDYGLRLEPQTHDEVADLVRGFNAMAAALGRQRADLERRREYVETLLRHDTTGVVSLDAAGRIVTVNPAAQALLDPQGSGLRFGADLPQELSSRAELQPLAAALASNPASGRAVEVDLERRGERRRIQAVRVELPAASGGSVGTLVLLDDVTDLTRSNQLEAWAEMARVIAHEIKNPLTPIQLSADHLRRILLDRGGNTAPEVERCLDTIGKQVRALHEIAGEFSTYARLPDLNLEPGDAAEVVRTTLDPYRAAAAPGVDLVERYETVPAVLVDRRTLSRALINLIENALQAMPEGGTLTVSVRHVTAAGQVAIVVSDTGVGLDRAVRRRLFEPYFSTKSSGTGLGLAIVRRAVEAHGGTIEVRSEPGNGTEFEIRLDLDENRT